MARRRVMREGQCGDAHGFRLDHWCTRDQGHGGPCALVPIEDMEIDKEEGAAIHRRAVDTARLEAHKTPFEECATWRLHNHLDAHEGRPGTRHRLSPDAIEFVLGDAIFFVEEREGSLVLRLREGAITVEPVCSNVVKIGRKARP